MGHVIFVGWFLSVAVLTSLLNSEFKYWASSTLIGLHASFFRLHFVVSRGAPYIASFSIDGTSNFYWVVSQCRNLNFIAEQRLLISGK